MNDLTKAHLRALMYFYAIMAVPFALAWGLYFWLSERQKTRI